MLELMKLMGGVDMFDQGDGRECGALRVLCSVKVVVSCVRGLRWLC